MASELNSSDARVVLRQIKFFMGGFVLLFLVPLVGHAIYLDGRLETLRYSPPSELEGHENVRSDLHNLALDPVEGQTVYVPAYSHIYHGGGSPYLLTVTLSVRNTSTVDEIVVDFVRYFDTKGKEIKSYLDKPVRLPALGTTEVVVEAKDTSGGSGANFLVKWHANQPVTQPIIEAVMISTKSDQGISFARRGAVVSVSVPTGDAPAEPAGAGGESE